MEKTPFQKAAELFYNKLARPQYAAYLQDKSLRRILFDNCLIEAMAARVFNGQNMVSQKYKGGDF